jgi:hypothetical protein
MFIGRRGQTGGAGQGRQQGGNRPGAGPGGYCVCPNCGHRVEHKVAKPCYQVKCPKCGTAMQRE